MAFFCSPALAAATAAFYYGQKVPVQELCMYDYVVLDPYAHFDPKAFKDTISSPISYVSLGEVRKGVPYEKDIKAEWVIGANKDWNGNKIMDQTNLAWQEYFLNKLIDPLWEKGYRGFFLDTLDSYTLAVRDPALQKKQIDAMAKLIQQIKMRHPDAKIILNRGFHLLPQVYPQVDAVVIESLYRAWNQASRSYENTAPFEQNMLFGKIREIQAMDVPIIVIDYLPPNQQDQAQALADKIAAQGLIPWITDSLLQKIYLKNTKPCRKL